MNRKGKGNHIQGKPHGKWSKLKREKIKKMDRRELIKKLLAGSGFLCLPPYCYSAMGSYKNPYGTQEPLGVYINWSSYDELSDNVKLDEALAMKQLSHLSRLKKAGARLDYYLMDMFWFEAPSCFREFRHESWPEGPGKWLEGCKKAGVKPGLWLSTNVFGWSDTNFIKPAGKWMDSLTSSGNRACLFSGGYLHDLLTAMQMWYDKGVRMFKFDFADFYAATPSLEKTMRKGEIFELNKKSWIAALKQFREKNREVVLLAYNGYGGEPYTSTTHPWEGKPIDPKWLEAFNSLYCGDPRIADIPVFNFWRGADMYSDFMVRQYEANGIDLKDIDSSSFMIGTTGTCYSKGKSGWKGSLLLSLIRGGWMNTYYGNLDLLTDSDAAWFAKAQGFLMGLQKHASFASFGKLPSERQPYGFSALSGAGEVMAVVNPSQEVKETGLPVRYKGSGQKVLFADSGFAPQLKNGRLVLGPEQMALVGFGEYANDQYSLGVQEDVVIPGSIEKLDIAFRQKGASEIEAELLPDNNTGRLRLVFELTDSNGEPFKIDSGSLTAPTPMDEIFIIKASQGKKNIPLEYNYGRRLWSGISWAVAEVPERAYEYGMPLKIAFKVEARGEFSMEGVVYKVKYK